jgi:hypothetical protein
VCAPGVTGLAINFESKYNKPAIPVVLAEFKDQLTDVAYEKGMPGIRIQYIRGSVWGKTGEQLRKSVVFGNNPVTGKPVMQEMVDKLIKPLTAEEKQTGEWKRNVGPAIYSGTAAELQKLFLEKRYTDFLPVILPTEELVAEMLKATSHDPDEQLGRMNPGSDAGETWTYTVKTAAINAVMSGAKPEYFPVILAIGSAGQTGVNVSDNGFAAAAVINGKIRDEIGLNYDVGAMGPYAHANTTIGRAWNLLSINGANCGKVGTTYMGTVGNPMNLINIMIAENEENSPFQPLSVRRGSKPGENVITLFTGWGVLSAKNWKANVWGTVMNYPKIIKDIYEQQDSMFGTCAVLSPPIANFVKDAGFDTVEQFTEYVTNPAATGPTVADATAAVKTPFGAVNPKEAAAPKGPAAPKGKIGGFRMGSNFTVIVTGASNNNYFSMGGLVPGRGIMIDDWR